MKKPLSCNHAQTKVRVSLIHRVIPASLGIFCAVMANGMTFAESATTPESPDTLLAAAATSAEAKPETSPPKSEKSTKTAVKGMPSRLTGPFDDESLRKLTPNQKRALLRLVSTPKERLAGMRNALNAVIKMSPEERERIRKQLEKMRDEEARKPASRPRENILESHWRKLPEKERKKEQERFQKMTPEERRAFVTEIHRKHARHSPHAGKNSPQKSKPETTSATPQNPGTAQETAPQPAPAPTAAPAATPDTPKQ